MMTLFHVTTEPTSSLAKVLSVTPNPSEGTACTDAKTSSWFIQTVVQYVVPLNMEQLIQFKGSYIHLMRLQGIFT